jgi:hypothetical protein
MFKSSKPLKKGLSEMEGIAFVSKGAVNQVDWREAMLADLLVKDRATSKW